MSKNKQNSVALATALQNDIHAAETVDEQTLRDMLAQHEQALFIINLRLQAATAASDTPRVTELEKDVETEKKYCAFFLAQLNELFPSSKITKHDFRDIEQQVVVNDYLQFLRLRRDAKLQYDAAQFTGNQTHADMAQMEVTRAMKYLAFYKPKFERFAKKAG